MSESNVEDIYPLSPLQHGMLFHTIYEGGDQSQEYVGQAIDMYEGPLDIDRFKKCLGILVRRHSSLRTCFVWEQLDEPVQVVLRDVELQCEVLDWTDASGYTDSLTSIHALLAAERGNSLRVDKAPLLRIKVVKLGPGRTAVLRTYHHMILDGWSWQVLQRELGILYKGGREAKNLEVNPAPTYRGYIEWLTGQPHHEAISYWRDHLRGVEIRTFPSGGGSGHGVRSAHLRIESAEATQIEYAAMAANVSVNTWFQGAWALLLARYTGSDDILFGATVAGRPAELDKADEIVGLFINTLPARVKVNANSTAVEFVSTIRRSHADLDYFSYASLQEMHREYVKRSTSHRLFDSILVFENYPQSLSAMNFGVELTWSPLGGYTDTGYPLTVAISAADHVLDIHISYDASLFSGGFVECLVGHFRNVLMGMVAAPEGRVGDIEILGGAERCRVGRQWAVGACPGWW